MVLIKSSVLVILFYIQTISGIILTGPCFPKHSTEDDWNRFWTLDWDSIILSVPFATRRTPLFPEIHEVLFPYCFSLTFSNSSLLQYRYKDSLLNCQFSQVGLSPQNESYILSPKPVLDDCPDIQEIVRFWKIREGVIIWSCEDINFGKQHDEALLLVLNSNVREGDKEFGKKMDGLRTSLNIYLDPPLLKTITWPNVRQRPSCNKLGCDPANCVGVKSFEYQWIIYGSLIFVCGFYPICRIVMLFWVLYRERNRNRVAPS